MLKNNRLEHQLLMVMLTLLLLALTSCAKPSPVVMAESQTVQIKTGQQSPVDGWLLTDQALIELIECCGESLEL
jgi:hypothetical protein